MNSEAYRSPLDLQGSFTKRRSISISRAWAMLTREWIVIALGMWLVIVYVVIYGFLQGFTSLFGDTYGFDHGLNGSAFAAIGVGICISTALTLGITWIQAHHPRKKDTDKEAATAGTENDIPPELRLWLAFPMAATLPISLFWLGWTNDARISPWSGLCAAILFGFSWAGIYVAVYNYILDVYGAYASSALAAITDVRYLVSGCIVIASRPMYDNIGPRWTCTILGCLRLALAPAPFILYKHGHWIRSRSEFAGEEIDFEETMSEMDEAERVEQTEVDVANH